MKKGYIVVECSEDYEQVLCLDIGHGLPEKGILSWQEGPLIRHVFPNKKEARSAINRTYHYAKAFSDKGLPEKEYCKIYPILLPVFVE